MSVFQLRQNDPRYWPAVLPVGYALGITLYFALRYGSRLAEQDTSGFVEATRAMMESGTLSPERDVYPHGFAYQAIALVATEVTGLDLSTVMLTVLPFITLTTALAAFVAFRALLGNALLGAISAVLLFIQPDFVFAIQRGNHEKVTHSLVLLGVFLLVVTLTRRFRASSVVGTVLAFYLIAWALITTNSFFASSLTASLAMALGGGLVFLWVTQKPPLHRLTLQRLAITVLSCFVLLFAFMAYIYTPAENNFRTLQTLVDRLAVLFLGAEEVLSPYASTGIGWVTPWLFLVLSGFTWIVLLISGITWFWLARQIWRGTLGQQDRNLVVLWLFAGAFGIQVFLAVIIDFSGFLASNLQLRLFPLFMFFAIPLAVYSGALVAMRINAARWRWVAGVTATSLLLALAALGILKATNDPLVSNKWMFFSPEEQRALAWFDGEMTGREIWIGFDERLREMQRVHQPPDRQQGNTYRIASTEAPTTYILISDVIERRGLRLGTAHPNVQGEDRIYDNGSASVYRRIPETPYQP